MASPKFALGQRVRIAPDHWQADLRGRVGIIADPDDYLRKAVAWPATYWKTDPPGSLHVVYWIDFGGTPTEPGSLSGAEVDEAKLAVA